MPKWRKSTRSGNQGNCVELASAPEGFLVRDSKLGDGSPTFGISTADFNTLIENLKQR